MTYRTTMDAPFQPNDRRLDRFKEIVEKHQISYDFAFRLRALEGFEIVLILDDSSSMRTPIMDPFRNNQSPFEQLPTRWDELKQVVSVVVDLASTLNPDGVDIYFLNRPPLLHVTDSSELYGTFSRFPNGPTLLTRTLSYVLNAKRIRVHDRNLLILIATDGLPTDENGQDDIGNLERVLQYERFPSVDRIHVTFLACTNDLQCVGYLNYLDKKIPNIDVLDDYQSERAEVLAMQGKRFPFTYGDYVVKLLMGSVDRWFDELDEKKVKSSAADVKQREKLLAKNMPGKKKGCTIS